jgi:glycosyltransferase involved in cell wall biosynthesis
MVSTNTRRDLQDPLRFFQRIEVVHLHRRIEYDDLTAPDLAQLRHPYNSPADLYKKLVAMRPDLIQGVEPFSIPLLGYLWACHYAAHRTGARLVIVTLENTSLDSKYGRVVAFAQRRILRPYFARAAVVIVLNRGAQENVERLGVPVRRVEHILWGTWGVDTSEFSPSPVTAANGAPEILYVGRLHAEKGVFVLLDAMRDIQAAFPKARLRLIGDGPARQEVEARASSLGNTHILGTVKNVDMPTYFRDAAVLVSPSLTTKRWREQVGMTNLQAMACGVPVVSTRSGAIPEYVPDGVAGVLVQERDARALANAVLRLLANPTERADMGRRAREVALTRYDARTNVRRAEELLLQL